MQRAFACTLEELCSLKTEQALWKVLAFPKLVLRGTGDPRAHPGLDPSKILLRRMDLWEGERFGDLWNEASTDTALAQNKRKKAQRNDAAIQGDVRITPILVEKMRALISEGAPSKA